MMLEQQSRHQTINLTWRDLWQLAWGRTLQVSTIQVKRGDNAWGGHVEQKAAA